MKKPKTKSTKSTSVISIPRETIARLAFELFEGRGRQHGHDVADWLKAERILVARALQEDAALASAG